jgi:hypothetical protein
MLDSDKGEVDSDKGEVDSDKGADEPTLACLTPSVVHGRR